MKQRFADIVTLKDLVVNIGKWAWKSSRPVPEWDTLRTAKVWKSPSKNISEFVHQLRVPLREFREIDLAQADVALIQVGPVYNEKESSAEGAAVEIPAVALENAAVAMILCADGLKPSHLPAQVMKLCGERFAVPSLGNEDCCKGTAGCPGEGRGVH